MFGTYVGYSEQRKKRFKTAQTLEQRYAQTFWVKTIII